MRRRDSSNQEPSHRGKVGVEEQREELSFQTEDPDVRIWGGGMGETGEGDQGHTSREEH